ncbi:hypothetical protein [Geobacillus sp. Y412MC52]|uniref:hypothetical protein n=1 Tax=Geobacillus sp. (strain Y412MC52) TaxID=550542 RepID=UPI00031ABF76|nr:hypothetical protein [Geobacillus sp. Y412MC52]
MFVLFVAMLMVMFFFVYMFEEQVLRFLDYKAVKMTMVDFVDHDHCRGSHLST